MREASDHLSCLAILNLNREAHFVQSQFWRGCELTFRLATQFKGKVFIDAGRSLFNGRPKLLPGRSRRVSFVAHSVMFNVNQPNLKPMTMSIRSLGQLLRIAYLCHSPFASRGPQQILGWRIAP